MPIYNSFLQRSMDGTIDLIAYAWTSGSHTSTDAVGDTIKCALLTDAYIPDLGHATYADIEPYEMAEATGYVAGGQALTLTMAVDGQLSVSSNPTWAPLTGSLRYAVFYADVTRNHIPKPLIGYIDLGAQTLVATKLTLRLGTLLTLALETY